MPRRGSVTLAIHDNIPGGPTSAFALRLLGPPCLLTMDEAGSPACAAVRLGAKDLSLLAYIALEPGPHGREELATLLWGESSDADARASLRQSLKHLRDALGPLLEADRGSVALDRAVRCDIVDFRQAASADRAAAARYDIPHALTGFSVRHAPAFDEWIEQTRGRLLREYEDVLATLGRAALGRHAWREAVQVADRWLAADSLSEPAILLAVEASYLGGDRRAALSRFADYRRRLEQETGDAPGRALLTLVRRVESDGAEVAHATPAHTADWFANPPPLQSALIERSAEWRMLAAAWGALGATAGGIMLVEGENGLGKTRLADEFLRWVIAGGGTALRGRGYGGRAGVAYGPIIEILRGALHEPGISGTEPEWLAEIARLVPEVAQRFPGIAPAITSGDPMHGSRLFEGVAQILLALSAERSVVIAIDDLQWCDDDSCALLLFLTRRLERAPVLWLGMLTLGEVERDAPAARVCRVWRTKPHASCATLAPLTAEGVWELIRDLGRLEDTADARRLAHRLHEVTRGNPFYLHELLKTLFAQEVLAQDPAGAWILPAGADSTGQLDVPMSRSVHDAIAERVERLPEMAYDMLATVAVAETGCDTEVLSHVHGISRLHAASLGDALVERRLLLEEGASYRCAHPVIARVVRDGLSPSRRREVHRAIALTLQLLATASGDHSRAGKIARHAEQGGEIRLAYESALAASSIARERQLEKDALVWLDLAATWARSTDEADEVNRLTALLIDRAADPVGATA